MVEQNEEESKIEQNQDIKGNGGVRIGRGERGTDQSLCMTDM